MLLNGLVIFTFLIFNHFCERRWRRNISFAYICWKGLSVSGQDTHGETQNRSVPMLATYSFTKRSWAFLSNQSSADAEVHKMPITSFYCNGPQPRNAPEGSKSCQRNPAQHLPKRYLCNSCFSHEGGKTLAVQDTLSESWFQEGRLVLRPKSSRSWWVWWWRRCLWYTSFEWAQPGSHSEPGRCWCAQPCTPDYSSCNLLESSITLLCEPGNSLIWENKDKTSHVPVQQILTPRRHWQSGVLLSAFCVCEKFRHLQSFSNWVKKCCTINTSKSKKSGEERERMLIFSSAYRQPSENKHGTRRRNSTEKNGIE